MSVERSADMEAPVMILSSKQDQASENIAQNLEDAHGFYETEAKGVFSHRDRNIRLVKIEKPPIYVEPSDIPIRASSVVFASKHVSSTNTVAMTVHATGNLTKGSDFGGRPEEVSFVDPGMIRRALRKLMDGVMVAGLPTYVTMEATHHGPTSFNVPVCFVEIGSGPKEWTDSVLGRLAADAVMEAATIGDAGGKAAVGFGGTHYSAKFTRSCLEGDFQVGHIVPRHAFEAGVRESVIEETLRRTRGKATALIDWKGLTGNDRRRLLAVLERLDVEVARC